MKKALVLSLLISQLLGINSIVNISQAGADVLLDAVVASVDGNPITLKDVSQRIPGRPAVHVADLSGKTAASDALNVLIDEALISAEASDRKITVDDNDITSYIKVVSNQNNLTPDAFANALKERGIDSDQYRRQIRFEILRSKIASAVAQTATSVSEEELKSVVGDDSENSDEASSEDTTDAVALRQIVLLHEGKSNEDFQNEVATVGRRLLGNETFASVAQSASQSPEAKEGGSLGVVHLTDLSEGIQNQIAGLKPGQISKPLITADGARFFMIDKADGDATSTKKSIMEDARAHLKQNKTMQTIDEFFSKTIREKHVVEKFYDS